MRLLFTLVALCTLILPLVAQPSGKDAVGDPLPKGAIARLGTERLRALDYSAIWHPNGRQLIASVSGKHTLFDPLTGASTGLFAKGLVEWDIEHITPDAKRAVSSTENGFMVWSCETGKSLYQVKNRADITSLRLSADGKFLGVGGEADEKDKAKGVTVSVYDVVEKKRVANLKVVQNGSASVLLSGDGKRAVTWGSHYEERKQDEEWDEDKDLNLQLQFWDVEKQAEVATVRMPAVIGLSAVAVAPAGNRVAVSGNGDGTIVLFDLITGKKVTELLGRRGVGQQMVFSADGKSLAASAYDGVVQLWDVASGKSLGIAPTPATTDAVVVNSMVFTAPDRVVVLGHEGGTALVWEAPSGKLLSTDGGPRHSLTTVTFSADGKEVIASGHVSEVFRWDTTGKKLGAVTLSLPGAKGNAVHGGFLFAPPGSGLLLRDGSDGTIAVHDLTSGVEKFALPHRYVGGRPFGVSADGKRMVVGRSGWTGSKSKPVVLSVVDVAAGSKSSEITLGAGNLLSVAMSPDGKSAGVLRTVSNGKDETSTVFAAVDLVTGKVLGETSMPGFGSQCMTAVNDTTVLADTPDEEGLTLFDLTTGKKEKTFGGGKLKPAISPVMSSDGKRVAFSMYSGGETPQIVVYDSVTGKRTHLFKGHAKEVTALAFSPDGKTLATASQDTTVLLWDLTKE